MAGVSYIATIYNKHPYLPFLIAGLAAQEPGFEREFIFVDDGSTDGSPAQLRTLTQNLPNVTILEQKNRGPGAASSAGLARARYEFIKPLGGDDMLTPGATSTLLDAMTKTGCALAFGRDGSYQLDAVGGPEAMLRRPPVGNGTMHRQSDTLRRSLRRVQFPLQACIVRADALAAVGGCDSRVFIPDYAIELRLARHGPFAQVDRVVCLQPNVAPGRVSENQAQTRHDMNLALAHFVADCPDLEFGHRRLALVRASGRAWLWARRSGGEGFLSPAFARHVGARLGVVPVNAANIEATCAVFRETHPIRRMPAGADTP